MVLLNEKLMSFQWIEKHSVLKFIWKAATEDATDNELKNSLGKYADYALKHGAKNLWIDVREFKTQMSTEVLKWRNENVIPKYLKAGVTKQAFQVPEGQVPPSNPMADEPFETLFSDKEEDILNWLD